MPQSRWSTWINHHLLRPFDAQLVRRSWLEMVIAGYSSREPAASTAPSPRDPAPGAAARDMHPAPREAAAAQERSPRIRRISRLDELDDLLREVDQAAKISDDAMREVFRTFEFVPDVRTLPGDPFSPDYAAYQFRLYEAVAGRKYRISNEASAWLDVPVHSKTPFPYYTQSYRTVSDQVLMVGLIIKTLSLPPEAKILEFGPGWGNTTLALSQMGYDVTAVDIEQRFLDIISARAAGLPTPPRTIRADFNVIEEVDETFDAILFYESFHHCSDHQWLVARLADHLRPGGQVMFAAEPIDEGLAMPWGLRLDGQSLWAIRNFGWLELGFTETYFHELMGRNGFSLEKYVYPVTDLGTIFVARPAQQAGPCAPD